MSTSSDIEAASAIRAHHAQLHADLQGQVSALVAAAREGRPVGESRDAVVGFLEAEILPHAGAEERTLYPAADSGPASMLVAAMRAEHVDLRARVSTLRSTQDPIDAVAGATAILALFESHLAKENERLIPALMARADVSLAELLAGMHELIG